MKSSHPRDQQPSSSAASDGKQLQASVKSEANASSKCQWRVKEEPHDEAWAADWADEIWKKEAIHWWGVKEEPHDEAWAADWAAEIWEQDEKNENWWGVKEEPHDEAWAADWADEIWEQDEKNENWWGVKEEPHDEAWAADWADEIWDKQEKKVRWWDTCFAVAHISIKCSTQSLSRLVFCEVDYCLLKVLGFPLSFIGFDDFLILLV